MLKRLCFVVFMFSLLFLEAKNKAAAPSSIDVKIIVDHLEEKFENSANKIQFKSYIDEVLQNETGLENIDKNVIRNVFLARIADKESGNLNTKSSQLYKKSIIESKDSEHKNLQIWSSINYAFYLYSYNKYEDCFPHFWNCIRGLDITNDKEVINIADTYKKVAYFLSTSGQHQEAVNYLLKSKSYTAKKTKEMADIVDNLGTCYISLNQLDVAEKYFQESLQIAQQTNDELRYAKALGNIAIVHFKKKNYDKSIEYVKKDIQISEKLGATKNTIFALIVLANNYLEKNDLKNAEITALEAKKLALTSKNFQSSEYDITKIILKLSQKKGDEKVELASRRHLSILNDSLEKYDGENVIKRVGWENEINNLKLIADAEKTKKEQQSFQKQIVFIICILLLVIIVMVYYNSKRKIKNKQTEYENKVLQLNIEKVRSESKLNATNKTLESFQIYLAERNKQIENLEIELEKIQKSSFSHLEKNAGKMQKILESHLMTEENWLNFRDAFAIQHPKYFSYLNENFPNLTDSNQRIIMLTKLEMSNPEISRVLGVTVDAVKKAKQRLRKKFDSNYDELFEVS